MIFSNVIERPSESEISRLAGRPMIDLNDEGCIAVKFLKVGMRER